MKNIKTFYFLTLLTFAFTAYGQKKEDRLLMGKSYAERELTSALTVDSGHKLIDNNSRIIKDSLTAVAVAEPILFGIYNKNNIIRQRPYEIYLINNYWIISGTLPKESKGGTFLIILDSKNNRVIKIIHGK